MAEFIHNCLECGKSYTAQRSTSRFCTAKCRQRNNRKNHNLVNIGVECECARDALARLQSAPVRELYENITYIERLREKMNEIDRMISEYANRQ